MFYAVFIISLFLSDLISEFNFIDYFFLKRFIENIISKVRNLKKILITGHTGFIGSNLIDKLNNYELIGISKNISKNLDMIQIKKDIRKITAKDIPSDLYCIIHLAAMSHVESCHSNPNACFEINVQATQNLLELSRKSNSKFIYPSTGHVYGIPKKHTISEDHPKNPTSIYAGSKLAGEIICESYSYAYDMDISIVRLFSVYGPHEPDYKVTSEIISQLLNKNTISLGNLHPKRDFIYVRDVVDAIEIILKKSNGFNTYNIGYGKSYSILDLCNILKKITGKKNQIKSIKSQSRKQDIDEVISNSSKIKKLGWKPKTNINRGLELTLDWYRSQK